MRGPAVLYRAAGPFVSWSLGVLHLKIEISASGLRYILFAIALFCDTVKDEDISWTFYGFCTQADGRGVQEWFDSLADEARDEARDTLAYLQHLPLPDWGYPRFEHLGDGLSEVRFKVNPLKLWFRIYGIFWPKGERFAYTFLYGNTKKVKNDVRGKDEAFRRKRLLENARAMVYEFNFSKEPD